MRTATVDDRMVIVVGDGADASMVDVEQASEGRFASDPTVALAHWDELHTWAATCTEAGEPYDALRLGPPVPRPAQVFGIGVNYRAHAAEASVDAPDEMPPTFTKFRSALSGPVGELRLPPGSVDWEVELVVVMGREARGVARQDAWDHVAGLAVGQDYSERVKQRSGPVPQFSLGKSHAGFAPFGPCLVSLDEIADPDDLALECSVNGETMQKDRTSSMIFPVPVLIERLASVVTLYPGDLIFTGTPSGVGMARTPPVFLQPGDVVVSRIEGLGELRQVCVTEED